MAQEFADGQEICHRQTSQFADGKVKPSANTLLPMAGPSANNGHRQHVYLPMAGPSAKKAIGQEFICRWPSHRHNHTIGKLCQNLTAADAVRFADGFRH